MPVWLLHTSQLAKVVTFIVPIFGILELSFQCPTTGIPLLSHVDDLSPVYRLDQETITCGVVYTHLSNSIPFQSPQQAACQQGESHVICSICSSFHRAHVPSVLYVLQHLHRRRPSHPQQVHTRPPISMRSYLASVWIRKLLFVGLYTPELSNSSRPSHRQQAACLQGRKSRYLQHM
jgi:hypothetical protein